MDKEKLKVTPDELFSGKSLCRYWVNVFLHNKHIVLLCNTFVPLKCF